jgi:hypothetical protein
MVMNPRGGVLRLGTLAAALYDEFAKNPHGD